MITAGKINEYLNTLLPDRSKLLDRMEKEADRERIPIIQLPSMQLIHFLLQMHRPKSILEIGMAIGYSTIRFAHSAPEANITSIEISEEMVHRAARNFTEAGLEDRITIVHQDAREGLAGDHQFDCIFIDAAKGQYQVFFEQYFPLLTNGGLLICDNVLYQGMVAEEELPRKKRAMITKLQDFNRFLANHPALETTIVPVGDGLALCLKRGE